MSPFFCISFPFLLTLTFRSSENEWESEDAFDKEQFADEYVNEQFDTPDEEERSVTVSLSTCFKLLGFGAHVIVRHAVPLCSPTLFFCNLWCN